MRLTSPIAALPLAFCLASACSAGDAAPMEPRQSFVVMVAGPATSQGMVLLDLSDTTRVAYRCDYPVTLRAQWGSAGETARWLGGSWAITPLPGSSSSFRYSSLIPAGDVPGYLGTTQLVSGQVATATLATWLTFPRTQPSIGLFGAHHARWEFTYTTPHMNRTATVSYEVDCLPTAW